jgi:hypothetical protein
MRWVRGVVAAVAALGLPACGGDGPGAADTKAEWTAEHGTAIATLNTDLQTARTTLSSLLRPDILGTCNQLRDSLIEARKGLPVPDPTADAALRAGLDAVGTGTEDCIQGARGPNIPQLERSFGELREASTLMEVANRAIAAWQ